MKINEQNRKTDNIAAIGIGAMIVFIALILVAAVASAVIISTGEKLQQNAQKTGTDTQNELSGKIRANNVVVLAADSYRIFFESMPGSGNILEADINYQLVCAGAASPESGVFTDARTTVDDAVTATGTIAPGVAYYLDVAGTATTGCGPTAVGTGNAATLWIHVSGGGSTYDVLQITSVTPGDPVQ